MYNIQEEDIVRTNDVDDDSDESSYDDEDELTRIIPPQGNQNLIITCNIVIKVLLLL